MVRLCEVEGCENKHLARGYCRKHYQSEYRANRRAPSPTPVDKPVDTPWQRTAHVLWFGSEMPADYAEQVDRFTELNAPDGWVVKVWGEQQVADLGMVHADLFNTAADIVPPDSVYQFMSDLARLEILHRHGGLYVDADFEWRKPITPLLSQADGRVVTVWERQWRYVANGFIYSPPEHQVLTSAIKTVPNWVNARRPNARANRITGPGGQWTHLCRNRKDVQVLDSKHLIPVPWNHPEWAQTRSYPDATAVHLWNRQRTIRGMR